MPDFNIGCGITKNTPTSEQTKKQIKEFFEKLSNEERKALIPELLVQIKEWSSYCTDERGVLSLLEMLFKKADMLFIVEDNIPF